MGYFAIQLTKGPVIVQHVNVIECYIKAGYHGIGYRQINWGINTKYTDMSDKEKSFWNEKIYLIRYREMLHEYVCTCVCLCAGINIMVSTIIGYQEQHHLQQILSLLT